MISIPKRKDGAITVSIDLKLRNWFSTSMLQLYVFLVPLGGSFFLTCIQSMSWKGFQGDVEKSEIETESRKSKLFLRHRTSWFLLPEGQLPQITHFAEDCVENVDVSNKHVSVFEANVFRGAGIVKIFKMHVCLNMTGTKIQISIHSIAILHAPDFQMVKTINSFPLTVKYSNLPPRDCEKIHFEVTGAIS